MGIGVSELLIIASFALPLVFVLVAVVRSRPNPEIFASAHDLTLDGEARSMVLSALRRTRRAHIVGAVGGLILGIAFGIVSISSIAAGPPGMLVYCPVAGVLAGSLVGIAVSQRRPRPSPSTHRASLVAREVNDYRWRADRYLIGTTALILVVGAGLTIATATNAVAAISIMVTVITGFGIGFALLAARWSIHIVEGAQDSDPGLARVDDALRAVAVRSIQHATLGVVACSVGLVAILSITAHSYEAVKVNGHNVFVVPDGGKLEDVHYLGENGTAIDPALVADHPTTVTFSWRDTDGVPHTATRTRPPGASVAFGPFESNQFSIWIGNSFRFDLARLIATIVLVMAIAEGSRAARTWQRPGPSPHWTHRTSRSAVAS